MRDVRAVNLSLSAKWKWRLLADRDVLWKEVVKEKYGSLIGERVIGEEYVVPSFASKWWRDLVRLDGSNWFNSEITRRVRNGMFTSFWEMAWRGELSFRNKYPRLFSLSNQKEAKVGELWEGEEMEITWAFTWRRPLFVWENDLLIEMMEDLNGFRGGQEEDVWWWRLEENGSFTVKSMFTKLEGLILGESPLSYANRRVLSRIWKTDAPSKVMAFSWKLLLNRIPSKDNLSSRRVILPESSLDCVLCDREVESAIHLFLHCEVAMKVWDRVMRWLGLNFLTPPNLFILWENWGGASNNKKVRKGFQTIWHSVVWNIWRARNDRIFNDKIGEVDALVEDIKVLAWRWWLDRSNSPACMFYEWIWNPKECLMR